MAPKLIALVSRYQTEHPEIRNNRAVIGRIDPARKAGYIADLTRLLIKDRQLQEIFLAKQEFKAQRQSIIDYAFKKGKGSRKKALAFLRSVRLSIYDGIYLQDKYAARLADEKGLSGEDRRDFIEQTKHLTKAHPSTILQATIEVCEMKIKEMPQK